jgi:hypothetical protein
VPTPSGLQIHAVAAYSPRCSYGMSEVLSATVYAGGPLVKEAGSILPMVFVGELGETSGTSDTLVSSGGGGGKFLNAGDARDAPRPH